MTSIQDMLNQSRDSKKREEDSQKAKKQRQDNDYQSWLNNTLKPAVQQYCRPYILPWIQSIEPFIIEVSQVHELKIRGSFVADPTEHICVARRHVMEIYAKNDYTIHPFASHNLNSQRNNSGIFTEKELNSIGQIFYKYYPSATVKQIANMLDNHEIICDILWHSSVLGNDISKEPENLMRFEFCSAGESAGNCWLTTELGGGVRIGNIKDGLGDRARKVVVERLIKDDFLKYKFREKTHNSSPFGGYSFLSGFGK